jgi:hypothetical protein
MGISYYLIIIFGLPLTNAYATLRQSVAGNSTFRGIVYFVTTRQIETPYFSPCKYVYPNDVPGGQKKWRSKKSLSQNVLIPWYPICYLTIASSVFLGGGRLRVPIVPDAAIWWCLQTGGGGVLTR